MRSNTNPIIDGEYCSEFSPGKVCPHLIYEDDCDTLCAKYEKALHPVWGGKNKKPRLSRCAQCKADIEEVPNA